MRPLARLVHVVLPTVVGLLSVAPISSAGVLVVDSAGGGDFTTPGDAVSAAVDGDIILIRPGNYTATGVFVDTEGKALVIVGDTGGTTILPLVIVSNLPAGKTVVLRHLTVAPSSFAGLTGGTVLVMNSPGRVHIEDCVITGQNGASVFLGSPGSPGLPGLRIFSSGAVAVHRSTIAGGKGVSTDTLLNPSTSAGGRAVSVTDCSLALYGCTIEGGDGGDGTEARVSGSNGGPGVHAGNSAVIVSGSAIIGGAFGPGFPSGASGAGFEVAAGASLSELDSSLAGGDGAPAVLLLGGTHEVWPGSAVSLVISAPLRSGVTGTASLSGPPNSLFGLFFSAGMGYLPKPGFHGVFLPGSPFSGPLIVASTNGSGSFSGNFVPPSLAGFGLEGLLHVDQVLMMQADGLVLSSATAYIQVEPPN